MRPYAGWLSRVGERNGQTWGKQLLGIRVIRTNGVPMDFTHSAIREALVKGLGLAFASSIVPLLPYVLDGLWPLWDDEHRAVHDKSSGRAWSRPRRPRARSACRPRSR